MVYNGVDFDLEILCGNVFPTVDSVNRYHLGSGAVFGRKMDCQVYIANLTATYFESMWLFFIYLLNPFYIDASRFRS